MDQTHQHPSARSLPHPCGSAGHLHESFGPGLLTREELQDAVARMLG